MDKKTENYTVARRSIRWPLVVFYSMLNIGGLNAQIIYQENTDKTCIFEDISSSTNARTNGISFDTGLFAKTDKIKTK